MHEGEKARAAYVGGGVTERQWNEGEELSVWVIENKKGKHLSEWKKGNKQRFWNIDFIITKTKARTLSS